MALSKEAQELLDTGEDATFAEVLPPQENALVGGAFEAADRNNRNLALWHPSSNSADYDLIPEKGQLDARARDVMRNDAYVRGGGSVHKDSIVGSLYALNCKPLGHLLGPEFDEKWEEDFQEEVEDRFTLWAESPENWVDASRHNTLTELVRLAVGVHVASGEVLGTVQWLRDFGRPFNTAIQMIDTDRLSNPPKMPYLDDRIRGGVERNKYGAAVAYHIRVAHPSDYLTPNNFTWQRIPARKPWGRPQVIHIFEQQRPDQTRGVAEMVSALKQIRMTSKFQDVTLQNAIVQATYAAAIESDLPSADVFATLGGTSAPGTDMFGQWIEQYLSQIADYSGGAKNLQLDGVKIPHLFPGTKLNMIPLGSGGPLGQDFEKSLLRYISAALGVSYEQLTKDYSATNYSSARAAMSETWKRMNSVKRQVADRFATTIFRLWLEEAVNKRAISSLPAVARREGWLYENQRLDALSRCEWIGASKGQIDELKETQAAVLRLKYNLTTQEQEAARLGQDWRTLNRQRKREIDQQRDMGILPGEGNDNMMNAASGDPRESETEGEPGTPNGGSDE